MKNTSVRVSIGGRSSVYFASSEEARRYCIWQCMQKDELFLLWENQRLVRWWNGVSHNGCATEHWKDAEGNIQVKNLCTPCV